MSKPLMTITALLMTACISTKSDDILEPSEPESSEPSEPESTEPSEPSAPSVTYTDNPYSSYSGWESLDVGSEMDQAMDAPCMAVWDMAGVPDSNGVPSTCEGCEFTFDITATYRTPDGDPANGQNIDNACDSTASNFEFSYGYTSDYGGYGAAVMYSSDGYEFGAWIVNQGPNAETTAEIEESTVAFDGTTFSYTDGYKNYLYTGEQGSYPDLVGKYFTNFWSGEGTVE